MFVVQKETKFLKVCIISFLQLKGHAPSVLMYLPKLHLVKTIGVIIRKNTWFPSHHNIYFNIHLPNLINVRNYHMFEVSNDRFILLTIPQQIIVKHDLIIWVKAWQISKSEFADLTGRTSRNLKLCIWEAISFDWTSDLHCRNLAHTSHLILLLHMLEV